MQTVANLFEQAQKVNRNDSESFLTDRSKQKLREQWILGKFVDSYNKKTSVEKILYALPTESPDFKLFDADKRWLFDSEITEALDEGRKRSDEIRIKSNNSSFIQDIDYVPVLDNLINSKCARNYPNPTMLIIYFNVFSSMYDDFDGITPIRFSNIHVPKKCNLTQIWIMDSGGDQIHRIIK